MDFARENLERYSIHSLRSLAKRKGVKAPTTLNKSELITQIILIEKGDILPSFSNKGRPMKEDEAGEEIREKDFRIELLRKQIESFEKAINSEFEKLKDLISEY